VPQAGGLEVLPLLLLPALPARLFRQLQPPAHWLQRLFPMRHPPYQGGLGNDPGRTPETALSPGQTIQTALLSFSLLSVHAEAWCIALRCIKTTIREGKSRWKCPACDTSDYGTKYYVDYVRTSLTVNCPWPVLAVR